MWVMNQWMLWRHAIVRRGIQLCGLGVLLLVGLNQQAQAQAFTCDATLYLSQTNTLYKVNTAANPFTYPAVGAAGTPFNAMGYNPADNYLYALHTAAGLAGTELIRIDVNGIQQNLGVVSGLPPTAASIAYFSGAFSAAGDNILYVKDSLTDVVAGSNLMYKIDVVTRTATLLTLSRNITPLDLDFIGGQMYTVDYRGQLMSINPSTGVITDIGTSPGAMSFGGVFAASNGFFGVANAGGFYQFDLVTGQRTQISGSPASTSNDGARCPNQPLLFLADLAVTKTDNKTIYTPGTNVVYTIVASNNGPFGAQNARVQDPLPTNITTASWTCTAANGAVCRTASGTGAIDTRVDLPVGGTATFTLTMAVPASFTGPLTNTATVAVDVGNTDPVPGNNTATDTDQPVPRVTIQKVSLGGVGAFNFTGSNGIAAQALTTTVAGTAVSGAAQFLTTPSTITTITETAPPTGYVLSAISCTGLPTGGTATTALATRTVTLNAAATAVGADITCTFTNSRTPQIRLQKSLPSGRAVAADQFTLDMTGMTSLTTTGTGNTATGVLTHSGAVAGTAYTLSETAAAGANLANYTTAYSCTNALAGGQTPSGTGASFAVTPVVGDDLTCTLANTAAMASLQIVKAGLPATVSTNGLVNYTITVTNNGGATVTGAQVFDTVPAGLDCTTPPLAAPTCSACASAITATALTTAPGVTLTALAPAAVATITLQCRATATGQ